MHVVDKWVSALSRFVPKVEDRLRYHEACVACHVAEQVFSGTQATLYLMGLNADCVKAAMALTRGYSQRVALHPSRTAKILATAARRTEVSDGVARNNRGNTEVRHG